MANSIDRAFEAYCAQLVAIGHDRHWIRRNSPALLERYGRDPTPFPPVALPEARRDRYDEL